MERNDLLLLRLARLSDFIRENPGISTAETAAHFACSLPEIRADIERLIEASEGDGRLERPFFFDYSLYTESDCLQLSDERPLASAFSITSAEASLLLSGLEVLAPTMSPQEREMLPRLAAKIVSLTNSEVSDGEVHILSDMTGISFYQQLRIAIQSRRSVEVEYLSAKGQKSTRVIDPFVLYQVEDGWIVQAWCHQARSERAFRLDRIHRLKVTEQSQLEKGPGRRKRDPLCEVVLRPSALWRLADLPSAKVKKAKDSISVSLRAWDEKWIVGRLVWMYDDIISVTPDRYLTLAQESAKRAKNTWAEWKP